MSQRIRGKEATLQIVVDGDLKGGSFVKVTEFNITPQEEITTTPMIGEVEDDLDFLHKGYDIDFTCQEQDAKLIKFHLDVVKRELARQAHPKINIIATFAYRSPTEPSETIVCENVFLKMDGRTVGGGNEYITNKFSGKFKKLVEG